GAGPVIGQRIEPDVDPMLRIPRERDPPRPAGAADAEVPQPFPEPAQPLVAEGLRLAEARVPLEQLLQLLLVARQGEEVVLLPQPLQFQRRVVRAVAVDELRIGLELVVARAIPAGVRAL